MEIISMETLFDMETLSVLLAICKQNSQWVVDYSQKGANNTGRWGFFVLKHIVG